MVDTRARGIQQGSPRQGGVSVADVTDQNLNQQFGSFEKLRNEMYRRYALLASSNAQFPMNPQTGAWLQNDFVDLFYSTGGHRSEFVQSNLVADHFHGARETVK